MKLIQTYAIFGSFWVNLEIHKSKPLDSNLEPTNPPLKDLNLTNPMASLLYIRPAQIFFGQNPKLHRGLGQKVSLIQF